VLTYKYIARDPKTGQKVTAYVQADSEKSAAKLIQKEGLSPIEVSVAKDTTKGFSGYFNRIKSKDKILFSRQLSTLINAGLPLVQSLRSVQSQTTNKSLKIIIGQIVGDVEGGAAFSVALSKHPKVFNDIFISLVNAGEASGTLDSSLERLANQQEKDAEIVSKVRGAMVYPVVVIFVMIAVITFMVVSVLPQVGSLYDGIPGARLPLLTRVLLAIANFTKKFWWLELSVLAVAAFAATRWVRTFGGKRAVDKYKMRAWPVGPLFMKMYMARFARTGTTLISAGVPLLQVIEITSKSVNNVYIEDSLKAAAEKVKGGKALSDSIDNDPNFLELVPNMIRIGEQSGAIEQMMEKVADYYEKEVDTQIKTIQTIIEPVLMIALGVVAMIIVAAILLPVYSLVGNNNIVK
jgi:type IV pilus assembly protein PilC